MACVVYKIIKKGQTSIYDIIIHDDEYWFGTALIHGGGIRETLEKRYPDDEYRIDVHFRVD
ncbi:hypothetical protein [Yersinia phage fHe-Yen9-04]|uniref:Uncharacterized protein n=2 Tax=Eneladusvirus Yen904 TaxID=2560849 RepID=A0A2C9CZ97_9CAUD|nr:hypothetical protein FDJ41_gp065 [Yersinia phage fHe-Yen9-04]SOK58342.1 hypothetical protein [Yersinia phage fHe-Yen9-04]SOK58879.1 hypothetical protein [Yersinia phage fHe-Yen9-03]VUE36111.1 hypothetical protein [Yersinia phage fHe-Yen9-04]